MNMTFTHIKFKISIYTYIVITFFSYNVMSNNTNRAECFARHIKLPDFETFNETKLDQNFMDEYKKILQEFYINEPEDPEQFSIIKTILFPSLYVNITSKRKDLKDYEEMKKLYGSNYKETTIQQLYKR